MMSLIPLDYRLYSMVITQRYVSCPPSGEEDTVGQIFKQFYDQHGPREAFRQEWSRMSSEKKRSIRESMETLHDRMLESFYAQPSELMLIFRYIVGSIGMIDAL